LRHHDALHDFAGPVATVIAAGVAVFVTWRLGTRQVAIAAQQVQIAVQQARTAELQAATAKQQADTALDRLRYDLFEKRYAIYDAAKRLIITLMNKIPDRSIEAFDVIPIFLVLDEARFFFPRDICLFVEALVTDCQRILELHGRRQSLKEGSCKWFPLGDQIVDERTKLDKIRLGMPERFKDVMAFAQLTRSA
jgi:hypothetical protein